MKRLRKQLHFGAWNASGGLYGTRAQVAEARRLLRRALSGKVNKLQFLDERKLRLAGRFSSLYRMLTGWDLSRSLELVRPLFGLLQGVPTDQPLASAYWRKRTPPPAAMDPDMDGCGLLWCSPVAPATGPQAEELVALAGETLLRYGFEPAISLTMITERSLACIISITYDRQAAGEDEKAWACYQELLRRLTDAGFPCYRMTSQSSADLPPSPGYDGVLRRIKRSLDPNQILAPGRYLAAE
jgi:4-cresol dehydrogenase (hydroxylating)